MAFLEQNKSQLYLKLLVVGPRGSGKTSFLKWLQHNYGNEEPATATQSISLKEKKKPLSHLFEFVPIMLGPVDNLSLRVHTYTVPSHNAWPTLTKQLFFGCDGVIFIADARIAKFDENVRQWERISAHMNQSSLVVLANYSDEPDCVSKDVFQKVFSSAQKIVMGSVTQEKGVDDSFTIVLDSMLQQLSKKSN